MFTVCGAGALGRAHLAVLCFLQSFQIQTRPIGWCTALLRSVTIDHGPLTSTADQVYLITQRPRNSRQTPAGSGDGGSNNGDDGVGVEMHQSSCSICALTIAIVNTEQL